MAGLENKLTHQQKGYLPNMKLEAAKTLYNLVGPHSDALSLSKLQNIFLNRAPSVLVDLFEKLIFHGSTTEIDELEIVRYMDKYTHNLGVTWPLSTPESSSSNPHRLSRTMLTRELSQTILQRRQAGYKSMVDDIHKYTEERTPAHLNTFDFISYFANKLLECIYMFMVKNGYGKKEILKSLQTLIKKCEEETKWWTAVQKRCKAVVGGKISVNLEEFRKIVCLESFMAKRIFELTDKDGNGEIDQTELFTMTSLLATGDTREKLKFLFTIYDENGDGRLDRTELRRALDTSLMGSRLDTDTSYASKLADTFFKRVRGNRMEKSAEESKMTFEELDDMLRKNPSLYDNLDLNLLGNSHLKRKPNRQTAGKVVRSVAKHAQIYLSIWIWIILLSAVTCAIASERAHQMVMKMRGPVDIPLVIAKICGQILNFLYSLLLVYNLKGIITRMQQTALRHILPLDDTIYLHKLTAVSSFVVSTVHTIAHIVRLGLIRKEDSTTFMQSSSVFWTGVILIVLMIVFLTLSTQRCRSKSFTVFYFSHKVLAMIWFISLIVHAKSFIFWFVGPMSLFLLEKLYVLYVIIKNKSVVKTVSTNDNVTILTIKHPKHFDYHPGDYILVLIPEISGTAWRPFTISSSKQDVLTLHVRKVGWWTGKLYKTVTALQRATTRSSEVNEAFQSHFKVNIDEELQVVEEVESGQVLESSAVVCNKKAEFDHTQKEQVDQIVPVTWKIHINGPFSTPSTDILKREHAILVAGGIGITPFASILESVVLTLRQHTKVCPCGCEYKMFIGKEAGFRLKRIDLFWLTRSQKSLGWFIEVFKQLEQEQSALGLDPPLVNVHLHLTGLHNDTDMRGTFLQMALDSAFEDTSVDMLTGLKAQTKHGRPDWASVLPEILDLMKQTGSSTPPADRKPKVYACGPAPLCKDLRHHCSKLKISFKEEVFN